MIIYFVLISVCLIFLCWTFLLHSCECSDNSICLEVRGPCAGLRSPELPSGGFCCRHTLIKQLSQLRQSEPDLAQLLVDQVSPWSLA